MEEIAGSKGGNEERKGKGRGGARNEKRNSRGRV
jgi:hypothetical protein